MDPSDTRAIPLLVYEDIAAAHDFLVAAFGFESGGVVRDDAGAALHGEVRAGDHAIWLHRVAPEFQMRSPGDGPVHGGTVVWVDDVDAHCARARAAGADVQGDPMDKPYGQREYEARDPEGHRWWFATPTPPA